MTKRRSPRPGKRTKTAAASRKAPALPSLLPFEQAVATVREIIAIPSLSGREERVVRYREIFPSAEVGVIGYGPGSESDAHTKNESIDLAHLETIYRGYAGICRELLKR